MKVGIVVLNYKNYPMTIRCLDSLKALAHANWEAVVVDNASGDGSVEFIRAAHPWVTVLESGGNLGFAKGNEVGYLHFKARKVTYLWVLNNDAEVDPQALDLMLERITSDPQIGAVGCKILDGDQPGRVLTYGGGRFSHFVGRSWHVTHPCAAESLDFLTGASLLIPMAVIEEIGFIDDGYFLYFEDADFCAELKRRNFRLAVAREAVVYHHESATIGRRSLRQHYYLNRSFARFCYRRAPFPLLPLVVGTSLRVVKRALVGDWAEIRVILRGIRDGWRLRKEKLAEWTP
ncbi:glycosyltransferase family 2 protein [Geothrix sp. 21YS21S-2]|uniref:glycosyltransferase family 2 protein n=1 Tax=Geothrix sp. 21YS21S-2 TaxID=3068893 RepID=UPI0027BA6B4B|nr:glycosyltransferase family 2 protein [Geothrix sp. 21YS21S-2]